MVVKEQQGQGFRNLELGPVISARTQYALLVMLALAQAQHGEGGPLSVDTIASRQGMPRKFLEKVVADLRTAGLVVSTHGFRGGYTLARPAGEVSLGDIIRAATSATTRPSDQQKYKSRNDGIGQHLPVVWQALRTAQRDILDGTSLEDALTGQIRPKGTPL